MTRTPTTVVFDLGGVLFDWSPRYLYRKLADGDEARVDTFLDTVCTHAWNEERDAGASFQEGIDALIALHPEDEPWIRAYRDRWPEMLRGPITASVEVLRALHRGGVPLYALTNWSTETFPYVEDVDFMSCFGGVVVSGHEKTRKPFEPIYRILLERYALVAEQTLFIDDNLPNVETARRLGMVGHHFVGAEALREALVEMGLLD